MEEFVPHAGLFAFHTDANNLEHADGEQISDAMNQSQLSFSARRFSKRSGLFILSLLLCLNLPQAVAQQPPAARQFSPGSLNRIDQLPAGRFRAQIEGLPPMAEQRALQWLNSFHFTEEDLVSLHTDANGGIFYVDSVEPDQSGTELEELEPPTIAEAAVPVSPFPSHLVFHSKPGAPNVLFINFSGEVVSNTEWNTVVGRSEIPARAFSTDSDDTTFSDAEQAAIKRIWQRMAEDYAAFDIDVTTERPASFNNRTAHALITRNTDTNGDPNPHSAAGGVAYVNVFNTIQYSKYRPGWIYHNNLGNNESYISEAASHEIGHNLGLSHDGTSSSDYYGGHGSGDISWGPLMGTGYNRNVSQWSKGEYYQANNTQDDLATIAGKVSYRTDDHGNTPGSATALVISGGTNIVSTTPENDPDNADPANKGVIDRNTDVDVFSFVTGTGPVMLNVNPWIMPAGTRGGNLDVLVELRDEAGALLLTNNSASQTAALIEMNLVEGRYYLHVRNSAAGAPFSSTPTGYTAYGSIGQYFISGFISESTGFVVPPLAELQITDLTESGQATKQFTVTYSDDLAIDVSSIDSLDIRVTGPNSYDQLAEFISLTDSGDGSPRTATYSVSPAGGGIWAPADKGTYAVAIEAGEVGDIEGAFVAAGQLGQFQVSVPATVYTTTMEADPAWTLQPQWEYGTPNYPSGGPSSGFTGDRIIGYNLSGNYPNNLAVKYATTPPINTGGSSSLTLRFRRWLGLRNIDSATIQASADGVTWVSVWSSSGANISDNGWQLVQHSLPESVAGSSSLQVRWGLSSGGQGNRPSNIGWNIDDVEILGDGTLDTAPPVPVLNVADLTLANSPSHSCSVTYTDDTAVKLSSLDSNDLLVTGPNGYSNLVEFVGADLPMDGSPLTGSYSIPAPNATSWEAADNGIYTITLQQGEVEDTLNNAIPGAALGVFEVSISTVTPGVLEVLPLEGLSSTGPAGGPFSPDSIVYTLTNSGGSILQWTASKTEGWLSLSATGGALDVGASTDVTVSINSNAGSLSAGSYGDTISFVNATSGGGNTVRSASLDVTLPETFELSVSVNNPDWGSATPTNGTYAAGANVELTAIPSTYFEFHEWSGDASDTNNPLLLVIETNLSVLAEFAEVLTTNHPTPHWWLATCGYTNDFESAVTNVGSNGMQLWKSYIAGLDPGDPNSRLLLKVDSIDPAVLSWQTVSGRVYTVHQATNGLENFLPLEGATQLPWTITSFTNDTPAGLPSVLYRLEVQKP